MEFGSEKSSKLDDMEHPDQTVAKEDGEKTIIDFPVELLVKIIDMIPISQWASMESVSHHFQDVMIESWGRLREIRLEELVYNKEQNPYQVVEVVLNKLLIRAPNVASISGFDEFFNRDTLIRLETIQLLSKFHHLETISFSGQYIMSTGNFVAFLESSASRECWKSLDIGGVCGPMSHDGFDNQEQQSALSLECLKFDAQMPGIFDGFPPVEWSRLKKLIIVNSFAYGRAVHVLSIIRQCTQLGHLELQVPKCGGNGQPSFGQFMQGVADLENLSVLEIYGGFPWKNDFHAAMLALIQGLGRHGRMTHFALKDYACTNQIIDAFIHRLPRLKSLDLRLESIASLLCLANEMGQLVTLKLRSFGSIVNGTVVRAIVGNMNGLQGLHLQYSDVNSEDLNCLSDLGNLKELRIVGKMIEGNTVETLAQLGFGSCLETLEVYSFQSSISPEVMGVFFKNMPRLSCLKLVTATSSMLESIAVSCPNLVELHLGSLPRKWTSNGWIITSTGIQSIIDNCSQLKILKISPHLFKWFSAALIVGKYRKITFKSDDE